MFMLDTDICSYIMKVHPMSVLEKFDSVNSSLLCISIITHAELLYGIAKNPTKKNNRQAFAEFISDLTIRDWDQPASEAYALLRAELDRKGTPIGAMDLLIAAHALSMGATVVTNNVRHFQHVPKLNVENWL